MKKLSYSIAAGLAVMTIGLTSTSTKAMVVSDPAHTAVSTANGATLNSILLYLTTGAPTAPGNDLIGLLAGVNDRLAKINAEDQTFLRRNDIAERRRLFDQANIELRAETLPTLVSCRTLTQMRRSGNGGFGAGSGGGAGGSGAASTPLAATQQVKEEITQAFIEDIVLNPDTPDKASRQARLLGRDPRFCEQEDGELGRPGCSGEGSMPSADISAQSLFVGAGKPGAPKSISFTKEQIEAGMAYIMNSAYPMGLPKVSDDMPEAQKRAFEAQQRIIHQRLSAGINVAAQPLAFRAGEAEGRNPPPNWSNEQEKFEKIYGNTREFPTKPSLAQVTEYNILKELMLEPEADALVEVKLLARQNQLLAVNALLNYHLLLQQEAQGVVLQQMLNNQLNPVTLPNVANNGKN